MSKIVFPSINKCGLFISDNNICLRSDDVNCLYPYEINWINFEPLTDYLQIKTQACS